MIAFGFILAGAFIVAQFLYEIWRTYGSFDAVEEWIRDHSIEDFLRAGWLIRTAVALTLFGFFLLTVRRS